MSFIKSRLRRIESASRIAKLARCPECGLRPASLDKGYIVVDGKDPVPDIPEICPECSRSTRLHIEVVYEDEEGGGA